MRKRILMLVAAMAMTVSMIAGPAMAGQDEPGTPGEPNCKGQTTAFVAQGGYFLPAETGLGNQPFSPQEIQEAIDTYCERGVVELPPQG